MFTLTQIENAHSKVKSGADFPAYIQELKLLGVQNIVTWVINSQTQYVGTADFEITSHSKYPNLQIAEKSNIDQFKAYLKSHQQGETDYFTFCKHCAETGIEKWIIDVNHMTCTYFDKAHHEILTEHIPKG